MALTRTQQMSRIRGSDTKPELVLRDALEQRGVRIECQYQTPHGRVDLALLDHHVLVCIDGCFFHGCPEHYVRPRSHPEFWAAKLRENVDRDRRQTLAIEAAGWRLERVWEHEVFSDLPTVLDRLLVEGGLPLDEWRVVWVEPLDASGNSERRHLERLRSPVQGMSVEQQRHTRKWLRKKTEPAPR